MMRINMQAQSLWSAINLGGVEYGKDRLAWAAITRSVPLDMVNMIVSKETAKETGEAIKMMRMGIERVRVSNAQKLRRDFNNIAFKAGEGVDDFSMGISGLTNNLRIRGDEIDDTEVVRKLLQVVPDRFMQVAISIETLLDIEDMTVKEVTGHLRVMEQGLEACAATMELGSWLLLSSKEEDLIRNLRKKDKEGVRSSIRSSSSSDMSGGSIPLHCGSQLPKRDNNDMGKGDDRIKPIDKDTCTYYDKIEH